MYIKIDLKIFILLVIAFFTKNIEMYSLIIIFTLIHEIGHLLAGFILGFKAKDITIAPYGFDIIFKINYKDYNKKILKANVLAVKRTIIALAGPIINIIIAGTIEVLLLNSVELNILGFKSQEIIYANLIIAMFNLLPIYPLDGGRLVKEIIHLFRGLEKCYTYVKEISYISTIILTAISSIIILVYKNVLILIVLCYLWTLVIKTHKEINMKLRIYKSIKSKNI